MTVHTLSFPRVGMGYWYVKEFAQMGKNIRDLDLVAQ